MRNSFVFLFFVFFSFAGFCGEAIKENNEYIVPSDLKKIPQNFSPITKLNFQKLSSHYNRSSGDVQIFKMHIIKPWLLNKNAIDVRKYINSSNGFKNCYKLIGKNQYIKYSKNEIEHFGNYRPIKKPGIIINSTPLRVFPTMKPCFNAEKIGGHYPFDSYQNSNLHVGSPVFVIAATKNRNWFFVTSYEQSDGWIRASDLAFVKQNDISIFNRKKLASIAKDDTIIGGKKLKIGGFLPIENIFNDKITVLMPEKNSYHYASWRKISISKNNADVMPLKFNKQNIDKIGNQLIGKKYGWGGLDGERDCSATTKDFFATFGYYLPRNSGAQINFCGNTKSFDLSKMTNHEKISFIKKNGVPFRTLIYFPGHILLYLGVYKNQVVAFHNIWGNRIINKNGLGRNVVGKSVISTLDFGRDLKNIDQTMLDLVTKIAII